MKAAVFITAIFHHSSAVRASSHHLSHVMILSIELINNL